MKPRHADSGSKGYRWKSVGEGNHHEEMTAPSGGQKSRLTLKRTPKNSAKIGQIKNIVKNICQFRGFSDRRSGRRKRSTCQRGLAKAQKRDGERGELTGIL